jgi:UPF0271 protein
MSADKEFGGNNLEKVVLERVVLDTTALIFLSDFSSFEKAYTVQEVVEEVKDRLTAMKLSAMLEKLKVLEPDKEFVEKIKELAKETGDFEKLSEADIKIIALAKQLGANRVVCVLISDDYNVQNVAGHSGITCVSVFNPAIKRLIKWRGVENIERGPRKRRTRP